MADAFSLNERVTVTNALFAVWRLARTLISAGWTIAQSSNGTSFGTSDYWTSYVGLGTSAWIVLTGPGGRQICFWRSTSSTDNGKIIYSYAGGHTFSGASASTPGSLPSTAQYVRGSSGTFNTWFGSVSSSFAIRWLHVAAKDVSDGSFWMIGTGPQSAGGTQAYHTLGFFSVYSANVNDVDPYLFYSASSSATADLLGTITPNATANDSMLYDSEAYWYGWARNAAWKQFRPNLDGSIETGNTARSPYSVGMPYLAMPVRIGKTEASYFELKGVPKYVRATGLNDVRGTLYSDGTSAFKWACVGSANGSAGCLFFWDGKTPAMAYEY